MLDLIEDVGGWLAINPKIDMNEWNFQRTLQKLQNEYGLGGLFFWMVGEDDKNSSQHVIQVLYALLKIIVVSARKAINTRIRTSTILIRYLPTYMRLLLVYS